MDGRKAFGFALILGCSVLTNAASWWPNDAFDDLMARLTAINSSNCNEAWSSNLYLEEYFPSHAPVFRKPEQALQANRSQLWIARQLALSKAVAYSFMSYKLNTAANFKYQPGLMYHYMSVAADVLSNVGNITKSAIYYDIKMSYPNWLPNLPFNSTLPLFGPMSYDINPRDDNVQITDLGAGVNNNYTSFQYKHSPWYTKIGYLPDAWSGRDSIQKQGHEVRIKYQDTSQTYRFFSMRLPEKGDRLDGFQPVVFTSPYFDCQKTNTWVVSAVSPLLDYLPRYLDWTRLRRHRFVAEAVVDVPLFAIDINQCPLSLGNEQPNRMAGTARCKNTTQCWPLPGFGLTRGGYECRCIPGLVYPQRQAGPFQGSDIEAASQEEYESGFNCVSVTEYNITQSEGIGQDPSPGDRAMPEEDMHIDEEKLNSVDDIIRIYNRGVNDFKCDNRSSKPLLPEGSAYGSSETFTVQRQIAVRLSNFLSNFLQNLADPESLWQTPKEDRPFNKDQLIAEVLSIVMSDPYVTGSGIYFDADRFTDIDGYQLQYFAPYAYKKRNKSCNVSSDADDDSGDNAIEVRDRSDSTPYVNEQWFSLLKERSSAQSSPLKQFTQNSLIRSDIRGSTLEDFRRYPMEYSSAVAKDGFWTEPYCPCDGFVDEWIITYAVPFFGKGNIFSGVVTVDVPLASLDVNQCWQPISVKNAFANTALCDYATTQCEPIRRNGYTLDSYQCACRPGYIYPNGTEGPFSAQDVKNAFERNEKLSCIPIMVPENDSQEPTMVPEKDSGDNNKTRENPDETSGSQDLISNHKYIAIYMYIICSCFSVFTQI